MPKQIKSVLFVLLFLFSFGGFTQDFTATVSKSVLTEGERFHYTLHIKTNGVKISQPNFEGFRLVQGPIQQSSYQNINGKTRQELSWDYILLAQKEGVFTIPSVTLTTAKGELKTEAIEVTVKKESPLLKKQAVNNDFFLLSTISKKNMYKGEQILLTYVLYTKIDGQLALKKSPDLDGFWKKEIEKEHSFSSVIINGQRWQKGVIQEVILIPQKSGELIIDPLEITLTQSIVKRDSWGFPRSRENLEHKIKSKPLHINVKALPKNAPKSFTGAVGEFQLSSTINKTEVNANDGIDYKVKISGQGNFHLFSQPVIQFPEDFEVYDPKVSNKYSIKYSGTKGSKEWNYLVRPRFGGDFTIPSVLFTYFSPKKKKYITLTTEEFQLKVAKGKNEENTTFRSQVNKESVEELDHTIRYIHTSGANLNKSSKSWFGSWVHYLLLFLAPVIVIFGYLFKKKLQADGKDIVGTKRKKANKMASKYLAEAEKNKADKSKFYELLGRALYGYLSDKLSIPLSELNQSNIKEKLTELLSETEIASLLNTLESCEMAKYAPMTDVSEDDLLKKAEEIIELIEKGKG